MAQTPPGDMLYNQTGVVGIPQVSASFDPSSLTGVTPDGDEFAAAYSVAGLEQVGPARAANLDGSISSMTINRELDCSPFAADPIIFALCQANAATTGVVFCPGGDCGDFYVVYYDPDALGGAGGYFFIGNPADADDVVFDFDDNDGTFHTELGPSNPPTTAGSLTAQPSVAALFQSLPVEFASFSAAEKSNQVVLNWSTASESGNNYFQIERSVDGAFFAPIGRTAGAGDATETNVYEYVDMTPLAGVNYYRLRQVDFDGAFSFSGVVLADIGGSAVSTTRIFPNPANDHLTVVVSQKWEGAEVAATLFDVAGKQVLAWRQVTGSSLNVQLGELPAGVYNLRLANVNDAVTQRVVVRR